MEAAVGVEPTNEGFADPCLTTWRRRPVWGYDRFPNYTAGGRFCKDGPHRGRDGKGPPRSAFSVTLGPSFVKIM